nr:YceI family protein [Candidatus Eremiobacteraeota bacterium]
PQRDTHLKSPDFLDAEKYAAITFKSEGIDAVNDTDFEVTGLLSIHGVTKQVQFGVHVEGTGKDPWGNNRVAYSASLRINREDFGLTWNQALETGGFLVSKEIDIELEVQAIPAA